MRMNISARLAVLRKLVYKLEKACTEKGNRREEPKYHASISKILSADYKWNRGKRLLCNSSVIYRSFVLKFSLLLCNMYLKCINAILIQL